MSDYDIDVIRVHAANGVALETALDTQQWGMEETYYRIGAKDSGDTMRWYWPRIGDNIALQDQYLSNDGDDEGILIDDSGNVTTSANLTVTGDLDIDGNDITSAGNLLVTPGGGDMSVKLGDNAGSNTLKVLDSDSATILNVDSDGNVTVGSNLTVTGNSIKDSGGSAAVTFDGSQNTTFAGDITVSGNNISDSGGVVVTFDGSQNTALGGDLDLNGALDVSGLVTFESPINADFVFEGDAFGIRARFDTSDGSDTQYLYLASGGGALSTRGAYISLAGNEAPSNAGTIHLFAGQAAGGNIVNYLGDDDATGTTYHIIADSDLVNQIRTNSAGVMEFLTSTTRIKAGSGVDLNLKVSADDSSRKLSILNNSEDELFKVDGVGELTSTTNGMTFKTVTLELDDDESIAMETALGLTDTTASGVLFVINKTNNSGGVGSFVISGGIKIVTADEGLENTDTDGGFCAIDDGDHTVTLKNRLGGTFTFMLVWMGSA